MSDKNRNLSFPSIELVATKAENVPSPSFLAIPAPHASESAWQHFYNIICKYYDTSNPQVAKCLELAEEKKKVA